MSTYSRIYSPLPPRFSYSELVSALSESGMWKHHHQPTNKSDQTKMNEKGVSGGERWYKLVLEMDKRIVDSVFDLLTHPYEPSAMEKLLEDSLITHSKEIAKAQVTHFISYDNNTTVIHTHFCPYRTLPEQHDLVLI